MDAVLHAIAEPRRRKILQLVSSHELSAGEIAARFEITRPAISQHLTVLTQAELVSVRREGARRIYRARPQQLAELRDFLDEFWADGLDRLKAAAEQAEKGDNR
jgi:DNA-binding transcriptional ArsR family regulator